MSASAQFELKKIKQLLASASNPKQKAMYETLLQKAQQNQINTAKTETNISQNKQTSPKTLPSKTKTLAKSKKKSSAPEEQTVSPQKLSTEEQAHPSQDKSKSEAQSPDEIPTSAFFQAVGIIKGEVHLNDLEQLSVTCNKKTYKLFYVKEKRAAYTGLIKEIQSTGNTCYQLVVYPRGVHFPSKNQPHEISFQLVAFAKEDLTHGLAQKVKEFEFQLSGLWQFIPPCRLPCISIFRNYNPLLLDSFKSTETNQRVKKFKTNHLPVIWQDAPVRPFRFNPKQDREEQGHPYFVQIKARFLPQKNLFTFVEQLAEPSEITPKFLKVSKEDKLKAHQEKKADTNSAEAKEQQPPKKSPQQNKRKKKKKKTSALAQSDKPSESVT